MELIIGREGQGDGEKNRLSISKGGKVLEYIGNPGYVPMTVSRNQISLNIDDKTRVLTVRHILNKNTTYVNGHPIESKVLQPGDVVELGEEHFRLPLDEIIDKYVPKVFDLRPLRKVWEDYDNSIKMTKIKNNKRNAWRSMLPIFSILAIALTMIPGFGDNKLLNVVRFVFYAIVIIGNVWFFIDSMKRSRKSVEEEDQRKKLFMSYYVCPNPKCNHFMGNSPYEIISQNDKCPWCKAKFEWR